MAAAPAFFRAGGLTSGAFSGSAGEQRERESSEVDLVVGGAAAPATMAARRRLPWRTRRRLPRRSWWQQSAAPRTTSTQLRGSTTSSSFASSYSGDKFSDVGSPVSLLCCTRGASEMLWSRSSGLEQRGDFILLCGVFFWAETEAGIFRQILRSKFDFESEPWPNISDSAKDLVRNMLTRDPKKRFSAHEVLCHPWIVDDTVAPDKPIDSAVLSRLKHFSVMNKLKKMVLRVIAESLSKEEIRGLKELFKMIDTDNSRTITFDELKDGLKRLTLIAVEPLAMVNSLQLRCTSINWRGRKIWCLLSHFSTKMEMAL